ncbi:2-succinyl-6-hydroxy-2,4-cyclohexadiene-1-carboxylate synthase [Bacillus mesophilus]|uniref:Putative 2-succinyl-6-hydroxy-2,4-cyclohexadiene-1-carboxylate synthase n=1 Tax=Bacillus mesophilus TaxID=1808955 RepID=A0A6M0Q919_9BACI|nr:2-succinyl-6-hydroxy-2,4-cyclohexadiene-1-carboxylate synthase [Bacillus mesophilus]MBM7660428.1 2-succinyl-6-hydroxy-2,4-cyclohexadiene-1-carboxylate synthase [Bacillus mesophilus]NEY72020.1 2-succinyl-6-hydroxy-2,4-cyclohexadiene-1-carboxylate synthase [Bacillus mesophilus]
MEIMLNGVTYSYMLKGEGQAILLLHGFTGCKENWSFLVESLSKRYKVIALDLIGHGQTHSPEVDHRYSFEKVCGDLHDLLDHLSITKVHLLGYSMGGRVALAFSIMYPSKVESLILESSSPGLIDEEERFTRIKADHTLADDILSNGIMAFVNKWEEIPLFSTQKMLSKQVKDKIREQRLRNNPVGLANSLKGMGTGIQPSYWDKLSSIKKPILLLCGELDPKFCEIAEKMKQRIPQAIVFQIPRVGHAIHVEQPDVFGKIVDEFLHNNNH